MIRELEFKVLCQRHSDEIYRYARSLLANPADAEDATQEVLLRLWNHLPTMRPFKFRAWLLRTTRCYCLDQIRRRSHRAAPMFMDDEILDGQPDELAVNPSLAADSRLRLEQARSSLLQLPEKAKPVRREGERGGRWVLLDYVDIVVHVQHNEEREFYSLDRLWKDVPRIPFVDRDLVDHDVA